MGFIMDVGLLIASLLVATLVAESASASGAVVSRAGGTDGSDGTAGDRLQTHAVLKRSFGSTWNAALSGGNWPSNGAGGGWSNGAGSGWSGAGLGDSSGGGGGGGGSSLDSWNGHRAHGPSPSEVANAIAMAKQASANVLIAQQQVQAAKDNVLQQQRLATDKETHATILTQKSEAAAAIQRSEAAAAAQSVILAQQRLAAAKSMVAQQQRIAAAKEAQAATALHNSAHAAAVEIQRTEQEAARLASAHRSDSAAAQHHLSATKDVVLGPLHAGNNHVPSYHLPYPHQSGGSSQHSAAGHQAYWPQAFAQYAAAPSGSGGGGSDWPTYESVKSGYNLWG